MNKIISTFSTMLLCAFAQICNAQIIEDGISIRIPDISDPHDHPLFEQRAKECVREMNTYITSMTMKSKKDNSGRMRPTLQDRSDCRSAALELFLDNGDSIRLASGVKGAPALMEVTNLKTGNTKKPAVKKYFSNLIDLIRNGTYTDVSVTSSDIESMDITSIRKVGDRYQCVVTYTQDFIGKRGELLKYADRTKKQIVVWFVFIENPYGEKEPVPRLGDIRATETERL